MVVEVVHGSTSELSCDSAALVVTTIVSMYVLCSPVPKQAHCTQFCVVVGVVLEQCLDSVGGVVCYRGYNWQV